jgi:hypothetical protein
MIAVQAIPEYLNATYNSSLCQIQKNKEEKALSQVICDICS